MLCTNLWEDVVTFCVCLLEEVWIRLTEEFGPLRTCLLEEIDPLCADFLLDGADRHCSCLPEDVDPFCDDLLKGAGPLCNCLLWSVDLLCTCLLEGVDTICSCLLAGVDTFCLLERDWVCFLEDAEKFCDWVTGVVDPLGLEGGGKDVVANAGFEALALCLGGCAGAEEALLVTTADGFDELVEEGTGPVAWWGLGCSVREDATTELLSPTPSCLNGRTTEDGVFFSNTSCITSLSEDEGEDVGKVLLLVGGSRDVLVMVKCREGPCLLLDGLLRALVVVSSFWPSVLPSSSLLFLLLVPETVDACWLGVPASEIRSSSTAACLQQ
jgi:hypothetical protein